MDVVKPGDSEEKKKVYMPEEANKAIDVRSVARDIDAAIARNAPPPDICRMFRASGANPDDVVAEMTRAWRIFSADFRSRCDEEDRRYIYELSNTVPEVIGTNYYRQIVGIKRIEARRNAMSMRGRVNVSLAEPFSDGARHEIHDIFSRSEDAAGYVRSLTRLPNLEANDIASTIWAGRIYQDDIFRAAPRLLKLKMLEFLPSVSPVIACFFVAQLLNDSSLPRRYRVLAWTEAVLRPHRDYPWMNEDVRRAYAASWSERSRVSRQEKRSLGVPLGASRSTPASKWFANYAGGDRPAMFDMERTLRGLKLSRWLIEGLVARSAVKVLTYCLTEHRRDFVKVFPLDEFVGFVCACERCACTVELLQLVEDIAPGIIAGYSDRNGATLLEYVLYRYHAAKPERGSWIRMCLDRESGAKALISFLLSSGCKKETPNNLGIAWTDIEDAANERLEGELAM